MMMNRAASIQEYIYFGYVVQEPVNLSLERDTIKQVGKLADQNSVILDELVSKGLRTLKTVFRETLTQSTTAKDHVLPLSGGMDSRALLGGLLENVERSRIYTVTFGIAETFDFELGKLVAKQIGVYNETIDLSTIEWNTDTLIEFAGICEHPIPLFEAYLFHQVRLRFGKKCIYWSGFMGDPFSGSHLLKEDSVTWEQARSRFVRRNRFSQSIDLTPPGFKPEVCVPQSPLVDHGSLCYDEQLDFVIRLQCYIKPLVLPKGYKYCTPFLHPEWVDFILNIPRRYREGQYLYKEILKATYPKLFSLPVKNNLGLPLGAPQWRKQAQQLNLYARAVARRIFPSLRYSINPNLNYIDFDRGLRERWDLKTVVYDNIQDLKKRGIVDWIDIDAIWDRHQNRNCNHADALTLLASLEINLKAKNIVAT